MFRALAIIASIVGAAAFAPAGRVARSSGASLKMAFEDELGVLPPVGFFDPLGLSNSIDAERFTRWRTVELKHGRVSMLAVTGYLVQEGCRFPGYISPSIGLKFADVPNGIAALGSVPFLGWLQLIAFIGILETAVFKQEEGGEVGSFGFGYFTEGGRVGRLEGDVKAEKLTKELQNGRLAMLGIMELLTHDVAKPVGESLFAIHHL